MITPLDILSLETWILILSALILIRLYIHKKWSVLKNLNIPHDPPSLLGLGNLESLFKNPDSIFNQDLVKKKKFGLVYGSYNLFQPRICISDPEILKQIYIKEATTTFRDRQRTFSKVQGKELNSSLTASSGDQWKRIRNTLSPTFSASKLKEMIGIIDQCTNKTVASLQRIFKNQGGRFDSKDVFGNLSMDVICSAAFSANVHSQDGEEDTELIKTTKGLFNRSFFSNPFVLFFILLPWTEKVAEKLNYSIFPKKVLKYYGRLTDVLIKNKNNPNQKSRVDIMQQMLKNEISEEDVKNGSVKGITRNEIVGNSFLMILAGYETTANTIIFFAYCLATSKEVQDRLREEIANSVEKNNGLTYDGINNMKFLDMCMKESQRLYGVAPRNSRYAEKDITINGIQIPAGTHIDVPLYGMSHDEEYWDEPWEYKPERFEDMSKIDPMIFQPFGAGPRNCIGMRFAITEVKMAICKVLLNFDLGVCDDTPAPPLEVTLRGSLQPKEDIVLKVTPRNEIKNQETAMD